MRSPCYALSCGVVAPRGSLAEESREDERVGQSSKAGRIVFWVLGGAFFLTIALLPNLLLAWFYTGGRAHMIVVPTAAVALGLMWGSQAFGRS